MKSISRKNVSIWALTIDTFIGFLVANSNILKNHLEGEHEDEEHLSYSLVIISSPASEYPLQPQIILSSLVIMSSPASNLGLS